MSTPKKTSNHKYLAYFSATLIALMCLPSQIKNIRTIRVSTPLVIQTSKFDPPRIALDLISAAQVESVDTYSGTNLNEKLNATKWNSSEFENRKVEIATMSISKDENQPGTQDVEWINELPRHLKQRVLEANAGSAILQQNWKQPSFAELAQEKIDEVQKEFAKESPSPVYIRTPDGRGPASTKTMGVAVNTNPGNPARGTVLSKNTVIPKNVSIPLFHLKDGFKKSLGFANPITGEFDVAVDKLNGTVIAEIHDQDGMIVATGKQKIRADMTEKSMNNIKISVEPQNEISGVVYNFSKASAHIHSIQNIKPILAVKSQVYAASIDQAQQTDELGGFKFESIAAGSSAFMRTESKGFYPGLHVTFSSQKNILPVYPESLVNAVINISRDRQLYSLGPENGSVVWGQVLLDGKPLAGVRVEALFSEDYRPIYLNGWLPDPSLNATSENGYFIFVNLPKGQQTIVALRGDEPFSHINVEVDENTISSVLVQHTFKTDVAEVKTYDAFNGDPLSTKVDLQSLPEPFVINGSSQVRLPDIDRLSLITAEADLVEYAPAQLFYKDSDSEINIPLVRQDWLNNIKAFKKISISSAGTIVGFVNEGSYQVYLTHEKDFPAENIVYFDQQGNITDFGVAGGGFLIFNVPYGSQSVAVNFANANQIASQIVTVDDKFLSTLLLQL